MKKLKEAVYETASFALVIGVGYLMLFHLDSALLWGCERAIELRTYLGID